MRSGYFLIFVLIFTKIFTSTILVVTKKASSDGSIIVACSDDDSEDPRIVFVPEKDHEKNKKREIYHSSEFPRYVGDKRGPNYDVKGYKKRDPIGAIDEVLHTFSFIDGNMPIINEAQLSVAGSMCDSFYKFEKSKNRIFPIDELARIALERCERAKDAIELIGSLAEKHGYFGYGESLIIADKNEAWVFEISSTPSGEGAMWVAKKVPDGEIFVAANQFRIRDVSKNSDILHSQSLFDIAKEKNLLNKESFDWLRLVSPGELYHPYHSLRRVWRIQSKINSDIDKGPWVKGAYTKKYPFSIKPKKNLSVPDVMELFRDHYEGTEFDMRNSLAAGPFGYPYRYNGPYDGKKEGLEGAWERSISHFSCKYVSICQLRDWLPDIIGGILWIGLDKPYTTCFVPFYAGVKTLPISYQMGSPKNFSTDIAWWAFSSVSFIATTKFIFMSEEIRKLQKSLELIEFRVQKDIEKKALKLYAKNPTFARDYLTRHCIKNANNVTKKWWQLFYHLIEKYRDGFVNKPVISKKVGYPKWWRDSVGYKKGPTKYEKP